MLATIHTVIEVFHDESWCHMGALECQDFKGEHGDGFHDQPSDHERTHGGNDGHGGARQHVVSTVVPESQRTWHSLVVLDRT